MGRQKSLEDGEATRLALIEAAAELFAEQGIDGVSIRSVNSHAGLAPAAVHYHYGSKDNLLNAVLLSEGKGVVGEIDTLVGRLLERKNPPTTRQLVESLAVPYLQLLERDPVRGIRWLKVVSQLSLASDHRLTAEYSQTSGRVEDLVARRYPKVQRDPLLRIWRIGVNTLIQMLSLTPAAEQGLPFLQSEYKVAVVDFVVGGIDAAVGSRRAMATHPPLSAASEGVA